MPSFVVTSDFNDKYATALRLEPDSRTTDLESGIAAKTADPLWFLTRQWQVNEFQGEDAGSPIDVDIVFKTRSLESIKLRNDNGQLVSDTNDSQWNSQPLEKMIEQEWLEIDWKVSAQIGREFEKQIYKKTPQKSDIASYIKRYRDQFPFDFKNKDETINADDNTRKFVNFMKGRVVNGRSIVNKLNTSDHPLRLNSYPNLPDEILKQIELDLLNWCKAMNIKLAPQRAMAWRNEHLDYRFHIEDDSEEKILMAPEYRSGDLDWYTFNACSAIHSSEKWKDHAHNNILPTALNIMDISRRWWEFEDSNIDFGHIEVSKVDLARSLFMQYALVYGDDWFSIPLSVPVSHLVKITSVKVKDVFGQSITIESACKKVNQHIKDQGGNINDPLQHFKLFTLSPFEDDTNSVNTAQPVLYVPPVLSFRQESSPLEEARFIRDEWSNMVWCIEHTVLNGIGKPVDGYQYQLELFEYQKEARLKELLPKINNMKDALSKLEPDSSHYKQKKEQLNTLILELKMLSPQDAYDESSLPQYRLATSVPENWIPFKPYNASNLFGEQYKIRLRRAQMLRNTFNETPETIQARTRLLEISEKPLLWLEENVVPRSGLRICLTNQRSRWMDGQTFVWKGRKILAGQGEGRSGLLFDKVFNV